MLRLGSCHGLPHAGWGQPPAKHLGEVIWGLTDARLSVGGNAHVCSCLLLGEWLTASDEELVRPHLEDGVRVQLGVRRRLTATAGYLPGGSGEEGSRFLCIFPNKAKDNRNKVPQLVKFHLGIGSCFFFQQDG